jgi:hypothetical protein
MEGEREIAKLNRLLEKYESGNKRAYEIIVNAMGAVKGAYSAAEECRIGDVLDRVAALSRYREYCAKYRVPDEVCTELTTALWIAKTEIPEILREKCGCKIS